MLSSDKPVYQPGQTIRLRALTLRRPDPQAGRRRAGRLHRHRPEGQRRLQARRHDQPLRHRRRRLPAGHRDHRRAVHRPLHGRRHRQQPHAWTCRSTSCRSSRSTSTSTRPSTSRARRSTGHGAGQLLPRQAGRGWPGGRSRCTTEGRTAPSSRSRRCAPTTTAGRRSTSPCRCRMIGRPQDGGDARFALTATLRDTAGQQQARRVTRAVSARRRSSST